MRTHRPLRVQSVIQKELSAILQSELNVPVGTLVTISDVVVSRKMEDAKIMISILPKGREEKIMNYLERNRGVFQHLLNQKMNIRPMPRIAFAYDAGLEHAAHVEKLLMGQDLSGPDEAADAAAGEEKK